MKALLISVVVLLAGCSLPSETADRDGISLGAGQMRRRYELLNGNVEVALSSELVRVPAGVRLPVLITLTSQADRPLWIPANLGRFFDLRWRKPGVRLTVDLDGMGPNDLVYARELLPGHVVSESVEFEIPKDVRGAFEIYLANHGSRSSRMTIEVL